MSIFARLPGFPRSPAGLERTILRATPAALWFGTLLLSLPALAVHVWAWLSGSPEAFRQLTLFDIYAVGAVVLHWTVLFTAALAAFIVMVMKGPGYVADAYPMNESEAPPCKR